MLFQFAQAQTEAWGGANRQPVREVEVFDRVDITIGNVAAEVRDFFEARFQLRTRRTHLGRELQDGGFASLTVIERDGRTALGDDPTLSALPDETDQRRHNEQTRDDSVLHVSTVFTSARYG
jgi:hypothetical protein